MDAVNDPATRDLVRLPAMLFHMGACAVNMTFNIGENPVAFIVLCVVAGLLLILMIVGVIVFAMGGPRPRRHLRHRHRDHLHGPARHPASAAQAAAARPAPRSAPSPSTRTAGPPNVVVTANKPPRPQPRSRKTTRKPQSPDISRAGRYTVVGVDRDTGLDTQIVIEAVSPANAKVKAQMKGVVVTDVHPG